MIEDDIDFWLDHRGLGKCDCGECVYAVCRMCGMRVIFKKANYKPREPVDVCSLCDVGMK